MDAYIVGLRMASPALELEHNNKPVVAFDLITLPRAEVGIDPDKWFYYPLALELFSEYFIYNPSVLNLIHSSC